MTLRICVLDFETYDPLLLKYGQGSCFKYHYPEVEFEVVGCGVMHHDGREEYLDFINNISYIGIGNDTCAASSMLDRLKVIISMHDVIICHNSLYDIGILKYLYRDEIVWQDKILIDTVLLAKHHNQSLIVYSLDNLCKVYDCGEQKETDILYDYAWLSGMYQQWYSANRPKRASGKDSECHTRPSQETLRKWCYSDMRRFPVEIMREYCLQDVRATKCLYDKLAPLTDYLDRTIDSDLLKAVIDIKFTGVRIDVSGAKELLVSNDNIALEETDIVYNMLGCPDNFNINSTKILGRLLVDNGYELPRTEKGSISLKATWMDDQTEEIYQHIRRYRKAVKVNEYIRKLVNYQSSIPEKYIKDNIGWLYPTLKPYGATATGRFSSGGGKGCNELNIQQIPRRDEDFGAPMRGLFLPHEGEKLICCDFNSQEPRLQVHYATLMRCSRAKDIADAYIADPTLSYHQKVADIIGIEKDAAKIINLGLSYGMGITKLIKALGLNHGEGKMLLAKYHRLVPFMRELQALVAKGMAKNGYVKTIGGRKLRLGPNDYPDKALNKLIQGSAGDQIVRSMIDAWRAGVKILFSVHDEIVASAPIDRADEDLELLTTCMVDSVPLCLPMHVDGGIGDSWKEAK